MEPLAGVHDLTAALLSRGIDLSAFGAAYLALLGNAVAALAAFLGARAHLVVSPNRAARDYGVYVSVVLAALLIATVLQNELLVHPSSTLQYAVLPQVVILMALHFAIYHRQHPWLVVLGASSIVGAIAVVVVASMVTNQVHIAHWLTVVALVGLLGFLWLKSVSTKRGFVNAKSIYIGSKETLDAEELPQKPWLGLKQWVALVAASIVLATLNSLLRGGRMAQIPALDVAEQTGLLIVMTAAVAAVPAVTYWLARKSWMPELTRFVWLVWLVVGFAFTYGNYLSSFSRA